jgi:hypothetical protein
MIEKEQLIDNYFSNTLSEEEQNEFALLMETDAAFKAEVTFQKRVKNTIHKEEHQKLKHHLKGLEAGFEKKRNLPKQKIWLAAASIALLVAFFMYFNRSDTPESLYANYYQPAKNIVHPIVRSGAENDLKNKAFIAYSSKAYREAHLLFEALYTKNKDSELLFYDAISLLEMDSTALAIERFKLHRDYSDAISNKTSWYLALAYLKNKDIEKSKQLLKSIVDSKGYKSESAQKLLTALD